MNSSGLGYEVELPFDELRTFRPLSSLFALTFLSVTVFPLLRLRGWSPRSYTLRSVSYMLIIIINHH